MGLGSSSELRLWVFCHIGMICHWTATLLLTTCEICSLNSSICLNYPHISEYMPADWEIYRNSVYLYHLPMYTLTRRWARLPRRLSAATLALPSWLVKSRDSTKFDGPKLSVQFLFPFPLLFDSISPSPSLQPLLLSFCFTIESLEYLFFLFY